MATAEERETGGKNGEEGTRIISFREKKIRLHVNKSI